MTLYHISRMCLLILSLLVVLLPSYLHSHAMFYGESSSSAIPWVGPRVEATAVDLSVPLTIISGSIIAATPHAVVTVHE